MTALKAQKALRTLAKKHKVPVLQRFFKTGKGQYAYGDIFIGASVPGVRHVADVFVDLKFSEIKKLLKSKIHEDRLLGLIILTLQYKSTSPNQRAKIFKFYCTNLKSVNNWDLVDATSRDVIGAHLFDKDRSYLYELACSDNLWERRISIISTFYFIQKKDFSDTLKISKILLNDSEDLMHKAVGWMLREVGKRDKQTLEKFLLKHYNKMPRTMLRYSIEKFPAPIRKAYLESKI